MNATLLIFSLAHGSICRLLSTKGWRSRIAGRVAAAHNSQHDSLLSTAQGAQTPTQTDHIHGYAADRVKTPYPRHHTLASMPQQQHSMTVTPVVTATGGSICKLLTRRRRRRWGQGYSSSGLAAGPAHRVQLRQGRRVQEGGSSSEHCRQWQGVASPHCHGAPLPVPHHVARSAHTAWTPTTVLGGIDHDILECSMQLKCGLVVLMVM